VVDANDSDGRMDDEIEDFLARDAKMRL